MNRNPDDKHTATELNRAQNLEALKIDLRMICLSISGSRRSSLQNGDCGNLPGFSARLGASYRKRDFAGGVQF
jgi:hypothetical protein